MGRGEIVGKNAGIEDAEFALADSTFIADRRGCSCARSSWRQVRSRVGRPANNKFMGRAMGCETNGPQLAVGENGPGGRAKRFLG